MVERDEVAFRHANKMLEASFKRILQAEPGNALRMALYYQYLVGTLEGLDNGMRLEAFVNTDKVTEALVAKEAGAPRLREYIDARNKAPHQRVKLS